MTLTREEREQLTEMTAKAKHRRVAMHSASKKLVRRSWGTEASKTYDRPA